MKAIILFILLMSSLSVVAAQPTGGGGSGVSIPISSISYTYDECNELYNYKLQFYDEAKDRANTIFKINMLIFLAVFLTSIIYILISLGMTIQQIKDKGFKKWWKGK